MRYEIGNGRSRTGIYDAPDAERAILTYIGEGGFRHLSDWPGALPEVFKLDVEQVAMPGALDVQAEQMQAARVAVQGLALPAHWEITYTATALYGAVVSVFDGTTSVSLRSLDQAGIDAAKRVMAPWRATGSLGQDYFAELG